MCNRRHGSVCSNPVSDPKVVGSKGAELKLPAIKVAETEIS